MNTVELSLGYIPLVDAAPLIVAREVGFAEEEGIAFDLNKAPSWSMLRDMLAHRQVDAAHMLSPVPIASALGLGGAPAQFDVLSIMSVNGDVIGVSTALAERMRDAGFEFGFTDAEAAGRALIGAADGPLRVGVPFPFSMHAELLFYWLGALGLAAPQALSVRTVPPPLMATAIADGDIDAFCVGEPWGSIAVEDGVGTLLLPGAAIWAFAPEKVLAVRKGWAEDEPDLSARVIRAVWRAGRWLDDQRNRQIASEILAREIHLDVPAEILDRALSGHFIVSGAGEHRSWPEFVTFHDGAAAFPWRSQAAWIGNMLAARTGLDRQAAMQAARQVFRSDLHRRALSSLSVDLPGASEKLEGGLGEPQEVASQFGSLILRRDAFFDGRIFDLSKTE
ncbi:MAG: CmpA/NrtA family ABC transporter substrate-binding protein [Pseudomonadota bacterium]